MTSIPFDERVWRFMLHFLQYPYVYFCSCCRCFNIRFICTFLRLSYVLWYHTAFTVDMSWVEFCSRSGIHLAFIYSDTINHKRITSHTLNRPMVRCVERKRVSERMSEQANKIQEIPFIATDEWSKWYCTNRTNERTNERTPCMEPNKKRTDKSKSKKML